MPLTAGTAASRGDVQALERALQLSGCSPALCKVIVEGCMRVAAGETISSIRPVYRLNYYETPHTTVTTEERGEFDLEFYTEKESPNPFQGFGHAHTVSPTAGADACIGWITEAMAHCAANHPRCQLPEQTRLPTRVIAVGSAGLQLPRIHISNGEYGKFAALSHCWGNVTPILLTESSLEKLQQAIPTEDLPPLFHEAITLARRLQIPYLWIDSLCILQDNVEDWEREAAKMSSVYADAYVVFAAHTAKDSLGSLLTAPRVTDTQSVAVPYVGPDGTQTTVYARPARTGSHLLDSTHGHSRALPGSNHPDPTCRRPSRRQTHGEIGYLDESLLSSRGWVFQERILATKMIHFTRWEAVWECGTEIRCECGNPPVMSHTLGSFLKPNLSVQQRPDDIFAEWLLMVQLFTKKDLTFSKDRLPAMAGLAAAMQRLTHATYLHGLWSDDLARGILWSRDPQGAFLRPSRRCLGVPSWSWASITGYIERFWHRHGLLIEVQNYGKPTLHSSCLSEANGMGITLAGTMVESELDIKSNEPGLGIFHLSPRGSWNWMSGPIYLDVNEGPAELVPGEKCALLLVYKYNIPESLDLDGNTDWLVLKKVHDAEATYRRVGTFRCKHGYAGLEDAIPRRTVTLV